MKPDLSFNRLSPDPKLWDPVYYSITRKPSAVAVLIFEGIAQSPQVLLIRRSTKLRSHKGQIGFPGGRLEAGDESPRQTALREASEEIGIDSASVKIVGSIDPIPAIDGSLVYPVVGVTSSDIRDLKINNAEVDGIHMIPVEHLMANNRQKFRFNLFGCWRHSFFYDCGTVSIWGLSAEILAKLNLEWASNS